MISGQPLNKAKKALIALHGRGGTAQDILQLALRLCDDSYHLLAPQAENGTWYPYNFMMEDSSNEPWVTTSVETVKQLIDETSKMIPKSNIILMGFSQGACLALEVCARYADKYGGVIAFSGGLIGKHLDESKYHGNFEGTNIFIGISDNDSHVPLIRVEQSRDVLTKLGANVFLNVYDGMGHTIIPQEIDAARESVLRR